jgi:predicted secreted protein
MNIIKLTFLVSLTLALALALVWPALAKPLVPAEGAARVFDEHDNGHLVRLPVGTTFDIKLRGNITTGYSWKVANVTGKAVTNQGKAELAYIPEATSRLGSGGTFTGRFRVASPGTSTLKLEYARPWEKSIKPAISFTLKVEATKPAR